VRRELRDSGRANGRVITHGTDERAGPGRGAFLARAIALGSQIWLLFLAARKSWRDRSAAARVSEKSHRRALDARRAPRARGIDHPLARRANVREGRGNGISVPRVPCWW
jgi:hypothetical protein